MQTIGRLHVLTDTDLQDRFTHAELARLAIAGGADTIQFRQKAGSTRELIARASEVQRLCAAAGIPLIVNDRLDVALACEADGAHLGQDDFPLALARRILGQRVIGGSAGSLAELESCLADGADYVGVGPVYTTMSKSDAGAAVGLALLREAARLSPVPIIAIGGITAAQVPEVMATGVHGIAVISAVCCRPDPDAATRELAACLARCR